VRHFTPRAKFVIDHGVRLSSLSSFKIQTATESGEETNRPARLSVRTQVAVFALAFLTRASYVLVQYKWRIIAGDFKSGDAALYDVLARSLVSGRGFSTVAGPTAFVMPGYPMFLAGCYMLVGSAPEVVGLIQAALGGLTCVFISRLAALLFSARAGVIAGVIAALYYEFVLWTSGQLLTEPLSIFLVSAAIYCMVCAWSDGRSWRMLLAGCLFGTASLVRPVTMAAVLAIAMTMIGRTIWLREPSALARPILLLTACGAVLMPWGIRNRLVMGHFTLGSTEAGQVLWLGNNPAYDRRDSPDFAQFGGYTPTHFNPLAEALDKTEVERNQIYRDAAVRHIEAHPWLWMARGVHKLWNMWRPTYSNSSFRHQVLGWTLYPALLFLAIIGLWNAGRSPLTWPLVAFLLAHVLVYFTVTAEIRFRAALWTVLIPFAAATLSRLAMWNQGVSSSPPSGLKICVE
jgi:4-amino-4-deoxy-L-arabinose transferase-like glycosyltransferase